MDFHEIEENLRHSFRVLARDRPGADLLELPGISVVSLGVTFAMFNAAFLSAPVETAAELEGRLRQARRHFESRRLGWSLWICEDWLARGMRRTLSRICESAGLRLSSEMPGMAAERIEPSRRKLPDLDFQRVRCPRTLNDFRAIGSVCFHVPIAWFSEVFNDEFPAVAPFAGWVGYKDGAPVCTGASVASSAQGGSPFCAAEKGAQAEDPLCAAERSGVIGLYNVATLPDHRDRGYGEAITRHLIGANPFARVVLQSTSQGLRLYERMGFRALTRILVYSAGR